MSTFIYYTTYHGEHPYFCTKVPSKDSTSGYKHILDAIYYWRGMLYTEKKGVFWPVPGNLYKEVDENLFDFGSILDFAEAITYIESGLASVEELLYLHEGMIYRNRVGERRIMWNRLSYYVASTQTAVFSKGPYIFEES